MSSTVCWLFFDAVLHPDDPADFAGHCHDVEYIGDCLVDDYLVPCDVCFVKSGVVLTYDTAVELPNQSGVIITPSAGAPLLAARFMLPQESKQ